MQRKVVGQVAHAVGEWNAGHKGDDGAYYHVGEVEGGRSEPVGGDAEQPADQSPKKVAHEAAQIRADEGHEEAQQQATSESGSGILQAASEEDAEVGDAQRNARHKFPPGFPLGRTYDLQAALQLVERAGACAHVATQLVYFHHPGQLYPLDGDVLGAGVVLAGGDDAVAEHEEALVVDTISGAELLHGVFHTADFRPVFEQYMTGLGGQPQGTFLFGGHHLFEE